MFAELILKKSAKLDKFKILAALYKDIYGKHLFKIAVLIALGFLNGVLGSIGIVAMVPLMFLVIGGGAEATDFPTRMAVAIFHYFGREPDIAILLVAISSIFIFKALALFFATLISTRIGADVSTEILSEFYRKSLSSSWLYLVRQKLGYLEFTLLVDLGQVTALFNRTYQAFLNLLTFSVYIITAFYISFYVTIYAILLGAVILFFSKFVIARTRHLAKKSGLIKRSLINLINENVLGLKTIKVFDAAEFVAGSLRSLANIYRDVNIKWTMAKQALSAPIEPLSVIFISFVLVFSYKSQGFSLPAFMAVIYLIRQVFHYVEQFQSSLSGVAEALPYVLRVADYQREMAEYAEPTRGCDKFQFKNIFEFKNVCFSYTEEGARPQLALDNVSFSVRRGETIGIIGPSGAGKTTIADIITGLLHPRSGQILLDGREAMQIVLGEFHKNVGYVTQDLFLKSGTIEENIKFYGGAVSDLEMEKAARSANIFDFIQTLPKEFKTEVGDRGLFLSTGQRQRIVLARVLARSPQILVLDEATSSLDGESEMLIKQAIGALKGKVTVIIIAHRLSTVSDADKIISLVNGRIAEEGLPETLLKNPDSYFYKMYHQQTNG